MKKHTVAIVLAAGQGKRMNASVPKQYLTIMEKPVIYYTLKAFQDSFVDEVFLVVGEGEEAYCRNEIVDKYGFSKVTSIVIGGKERYHSVYNALEKIEKIDSIIFIHDGARPFVNEEILTRSYEKAVECGASIVAVPVKDTIKVVSKDSVVQSTPERSSLWSVQTPQTFSYDKIKKAYDKMITLEKQGKLDVVITDDSMVMEMYGDTLVGVVQGSYENIKITTPEDMIFAEKIIKG